MYCHLLAQPFVVPLICDVEMGKNHYCHSVVIFMAGIRAAKWCVLTCFKIQAVRLSIADEQNTKKRNELLLFVKVKNMFALMHHLSIGYDQIWCKFEGIADIWFHGVWAKWIGHMNLDCKRFHNNFTDDHAYLCTPSRRCRTHHKWLNKVREYVCICDDDTDSGILACWLLNSSFLSFAACRRCVHSACSCNYPILYAIKL